MSDEHVMTEEWNTGSGYYKRVDELLTACDLHQLQNDMGRWYACLLNLYKEIIPKLSGEDKTEMIEGLKTLMDHMKEVVQPELTKLFSFEILIREKLEKKGMLTPKSADPSKAMMG